MQPIVLRHLLVRDWTRIANTPVEERLSARLHLWYQGARQLASLEGRELEPVVAELHSQADVLAERERAEALETLARDLAVCHALGEPADRLWHRRLERLVRVMGIPSDAVTARVERRAAAVEVVIQA